MLQLLIFGATRRGLSLFLFFLTLSPMIASLVVAVILGGMLGSAMNVRKPLRRVAAALNVLG